MAQTKKIKKDQVVWAKVKGYPWWPAVVAQISSSQQNILVNFLNDNSHCNLQKSFICDFMDNLEQFQKHIQSQKNKQLVEAIKMGKRISQGESNFKDERKKYADEDDSFDEENDSSSDESGSDDSGSNSGSRSSGSSSESESQTASKSRQPSQKRKEEKEEKQIKKQKIQQQVQKQKQSSKERGQGKLKRHKDSKKSEVSRNDEKQNKSDKQPQKAQKQEKNKQSEKQNKQERQYVKSSDEKDKEKGEKNEKKESEIVMERQNHSDENEKDSVIKKRIIRKVYSSDTVSSDEEQDENDEKQQNNKCQQSENSNKQRKFKKQKQSETPKESALSQKSKSSQRSQSSQKKQLEKQKQQIQISKFNLNQNKKSDHKFDTAQSSSEQSDQENNMTISNKNNNQSNNNGNNLKIQKRKSINQSSQIELEGEIKRSTRSANNIQQWKKELEMVKQYNGDVNGNKKVGQLIKEAGIEQSQNDNNKQTNKRSNEQSKSNSHNLQNNINTKRSSIQYNEKDLITLKQNLKMVQIQTQNKKDIKALRKNTLNSSQSTYQNGQASEKSTPSQSDWPQKKIKTNNQNNNISSIKTSQINNNINININNNNNTNSDINQDIVSENADTIYQISPQNEQNKFGHNEDTHLAGLGLGQQLQQESEKQNLNIEKFLMQNNSHSTELLINQPSLDKQQVQEDFKQIQQNIEEEKCQSNQHFSIDNSFQQTLEKIGMSKPVQNIKYFISIHQDKQTQEAQNILEKFINNIDMIIQNINNLKSTINNNSNANSSRNNKEEKKLSKKERKNEEEMHEESKQGQINNNLNKKIEEMVIQIQTDFNKNQETVFKYVDYQNTLIGQKLNYILTKLNENQNSQLDKIIKQMQQMLQQVFNQMIYNTFSLPLIENLNLLNQYKIENQDQNKQMEQKMLQNFQKIIYNQFQQQLPKGKNEVLLSNKLNQQNQNQGPILRHKQSIHSIEVEEKKKTQDLHIRKKVCYKLIDVFQQIYNLQRKEAQLLSTNLENKLKCQDPKITNIYKNLARGLHKMIKAKLHDIEEIKNFSKQQNFTELGKQITKEISKYSTCNYSDGQLLI